MPKRKFVRNSEWQRQPHIKDGPPPSLWWYARPDRQRVIAAYLERAAKGRTVPEGFHEQLGSWLADLHKGHYKTQRKDARTFRYWDIPSYARANELKLATLMKNLRELETVAKKLFPNDVPASRKTRAPLTEKEVREIRQRYLNGEDAKELAKAFRIPASRIGLLCREEKAARAAAREQVQASGTPQPIPVDDLEAF